MPLRLPIILIFARRILVLSLFSIVSFASAQSASVDELKKEAEKSFKNEDYVKAYKLYSQLVSNFPKDPEYNFRLGVCMIYAEPDKKKCLPYLKTAAAAGENAPKETEFHLGKAFHINYQFDEAIKHYNTFKLGASSSQIKKLQVDREIKSASNGKHLLSNLTDLEVLSKTQLPESDYFRNYKKVGGKLLVKPEEFRTGTDKKKKEKSVVFLPNTGDVVYFSSYGDNDETGRDIYVARKQADGNFGKPEKVKGINTEFDEDYPFLHPDGKTLYFASKGYNSMGGYDIFKSVYNETTASWEAPVNMEFPINSPDDDYLFVTDSLETTAYFSTGRQSAPGKIDVLKVKTKRRPLDILAVSGKVIPGSPDYPLACSITVKDLFNGNVIGNYNSEEDGDYTLEVPNGSKLLVTVETPGIETQSTQVDLPLSKVSRPFRQTISYEKGKLRILNYFDEPASDEDYLKYLKVIEKKAKLDVNEGGNALTDNSSEPTASNATGNEKPKDKPVAEETTAPVKQTLSNAELYQLAKQDAAESKQEAATLHREYMAANSAATKQNQEAEKKLSEANAALAKANDIVDQDEKRVAIETASEQLKAAEAEKAAAEKLQAYANALSEDEKYKQKEASLNEQYAKELDKAVKNKNAKDSQKKLEDLQKQIADLGPYKSASEELVNGLKQDLEAKEKEISEKESTLASVKSNLEEIKTAITDKETELAATKKKSAKKRIGTELDDLRLEQDEKLRQIQSTENEVKSLNGELVALKTELDATVKTSTMVPVEVSTGAAEEKVTAISLQNKYRDKVQVNDASNPVSVEQSNEQLKAYNLELTNLISEKKQQLSGTKNTKAKQQLNNEIKQLESTRNSNQLQLAANNKQLEELKKKQLNDNAAAKVFEPIVATTGAEAVAKLDQLDKQLSSNDNENFEYNGYENEQAQQIKIEADAKINDAVARQKKLKDEITSSKSALQAASGGQAGNSEELNKQADDLLIQAQKKRNAAGSLSGEAKTKALNEAKELEQKAQDKLIDADAVALAETMQTSALNQENIQNLINEGKSSPQDIEQAKALNEEATQAMKKASDLRLEANSIENKGARLGSYSNAVEKEAEALEKQKKALDLLSKSNPEYVMKQAGGSAGAATDVAGNLSAVNAGLSELATIKLESYGKLFEANALEIEALQNSINSNQSVLEKTPILKSGYIAANGKLEKAKSLKAQSDNATLQGEKLNQLIAAVKQQNEAIKQLSSVNLQLGPAAINISAQPNTANTSAPAKDEDPLKALGETSVQEAPPEDPLKALANANVQETDVVKTERVNPVETAPEENSAPAEEITLASLQGNDTTSAQVLSYLDNNPTSFRSPQAAPMQRNALTQLKSYENELKATEQQLAEVNEAIATGTELNRAPEELIKKSDEIVLESEELSKQAADLKEEAAGKSGEEKDYALARARELDLKAQDKMIESSGYRKEANENTIIGNGQAIDELISRLRQDDPAVASNMVERRAEFQTLTTQIKNLRDETNGISNKAAKLGAISNAEEKESELIKKQNQMLDELKNRYPDYEVKPYTGLSNTERVAALEKKKRTIQEAQYNELVNLTNAYSLEFESSKKQAPKKLKGDKLSLRNNAESLNAESKDLLVKASQENNPAQKLKLLTLSAKAGNAALSQLNKVLPKPTDADIQGLADIGNQLMESNASGDEENTNRVTFKTEGLEILRGNAYSAANPIPINANMQDGLVFRVQIGAFKTKIPDNAFKGLTPLNGETTANGYIRYTAGNFEKIENANAVKNDLRNLGYSDAFVVVYYNGRRITISEAMEIMRQDGKSIDPNAPQTAGITANTNVPKAAANPVIQESVTVTKELEQINGLLYTIQIGVYTRQVSKPQLLRLTPIFREQLSGGLFRYTAGIYNNPERLLMDKDKVVALGIKDAFVSAYLNGKRIPFAEAKERQANDASIKMEPENPIVFSDAPASPVNTGNPLEQLGNAATGDPGVEPFKNNVNTYPMATPENGVKENESGVTFKVQIGAFSKQVPADVAAKFSAIRNWPIDNKRINGLYVYNVGNFSEVKFAKTLRDEMVALGITDAFLTVYKDGQKLYGAEAESYLRQQ